MITKLRELIGRISPRLNTQLNFFARKKRFPNLKNPKTFDEKISWLKLYDYPKNDLVIQCSDKLKVRDYVSQCGYAEILNDLICVYNRAEDIRFDELPNEFVIKWNNDYNSTFVVKDKEKEDLEAIRSALIKKGNTKFYLRGAEFHYKEIQPRIIVEKVLVEPNVHVLTDYKLYCYNGKVEYIMVCLGRGDDIKFYFYNLDWELQRLNKDSKEAPIDFYLEKPEGIDRMVKIASVLSEPFKFVRADFYLIEGNVIFGELTFTPSSGIDPSLDYELDLLFGKNIKLEVK